MTYRIKIRRRYARVTDEFIVGSKVVHETITVPDYYEDRDKRIIKGVTYVKKETSFFESKLLQ